MSTLNKKEHSSKNICFLSIGMFRVRSVCQSVFCLKSTVFPNYDSEKMLEKRPVAWLEPRINILWESDWWKFKWEFDILAREIVEKCCVYRNVADLCRCRNVRCLYSMNILDIWIRLWHWLWCLGENIRPILSCLDQQCYLACRLFSVAGKWWYVYWSLSL